MRRENYVRWKGGGLEEGGWGRRLGLWDDGIGGLKGWLGEGDGEEEEEVE